MPRFNIFLLLLFIVGSSGCIISNDIKEKGDKSNNSSFIVGEVGGSLAISTKTALPEKFTLQLNACIRFRKKIASRLPSTTWAISHTQEGVNTPDKDIPKLNNLGMGDKQNKVIKVIADGNGCIKWTEEYDYAYSKQSRWIVINRYIKALTTSQGGTHKIPLAVNPWLQLKEEYSNIQVIDYRDDYDRKNPNLEGRVEEDGLKFLEQKKKEEKKHKVDVIIRELELRWDGSESKDNKTVFTGTTISAELKYSIKNVDGDLNDNTITQGSFQIKPHLLMRVPEDNKTKYVKMNENGTDTIIKTRFDSDRLTSRHFTWTLPYVPFNNKTPIRLYVQVIPQGPTAERVNSFEGIYYIANNFADAVSGNTKTLNIMPVLGEKYRIRIEEEDGSFNPPSPSVIVPTLADFDDLKGCLEKLHYGVDSIVFRSCVSPEEPHLKMDGVGEAGWAVKNMNIRFFGMEEEDWLFRKIKTLVHTSVIDQQNRPIGNKYIEIEVIDLSTGKQTLYELRTEREGLISFDIYTMQKWYNRQKYFLKIIRFKTRDSKDLDVAKIVAINPWDYGFTHGFEVNHPKNIRSTCFAGTKKEEDIISQLLLMNESQLNLISNEQKGVIRKFFCDDDDLRRGILDAHFKGEKVDILEIETIFHKFKEVVGKIGELTLDYLKNKFRSSKTIKNQQYKFIYLELLISILLI